MFTDGLVIVWARNSKLATVTVDNRTVVAVAPGSQVGLTVDDTFFLGGIPVQTVDLSEYGNILDGVYARGLVGCISQFEINGILFDVERDAIRGLDVASCDGTSSVSAFE